MKLKHVSIFIVVLILLDQILKIWIKTHLHLDESIVVFNNWFQLRFVENNGAAFGMQITSSGFDWGKILLSSFRIILVCFLGYYIKHIINQKAPVGIILAISMIFAGAIGNIIDSAFYGLIFSSSTFSSVAHIGDGYAPFMMGKVVDMFYFPLFQWKSCPDWLLFLVDSDRYFFGAIFNLADAYISVAVVYILIFGNKYFK